MPYRVEFRPSAVKALKKIPHKDLLRIKKTIDNLAHAPTAVSATKLRGNNPFYRIRCGSYRIIYEVHHQRLLILVIRIGHRKDVYARLT